MKKQKKKEKLREEYRAKILKILKNSPAMPVTFRQMSASLKGKNFDTAQFAKAAEKLKAEGVVIEKKSGFVLAEYEKGGLVKCTVSRLNKTYGFVRETDGEKEYFVRGKLLRGAMPGDTVLVRVFDGRGDSDEAEVVRVLEENFNRFTGEIVQEYGRLKIVPDTLSKYAMDFENPENIPLAPYDKVMAEITRRGSRHSEHKCVITASFGSSQKAAVCALSILELNGITPVFPPEVISEARAAAARIPQKEYSSRLDLRDKIIFTIDGADTKDIDDAISVERDGDGYILGVHIADVSHYVAPGSALDEEALRRGTSIYYANRVIPMLPAELSNGICSLNPNEDRLAFSCIARLDGSGKIIGYRFAKTVIRSRVKGVYSEINKLLDGGNKYNNNNKYNNKYDNNNNNKYDNNDNKYDNNVNDTEDEEYCRLVQKYSEVAEVFPIMTELADKLAAARIGRGSPQIETPEGVLFINEEDVCVGAAPYQRGKSQEIIEDFMLTANCCAARFGEENALPFVYRVHEEPTREKTDMLSQCLAVLNIPCNFEDIPRPRQLSDILEKARGTDIQPIVNGLVLRSMSKAKYDTQPLGHYGLALADYAHFTSPIRRYPDLAIHRIMSDFLDGIPVQECVRRYGKFAPAAAERSTAAELNAMQVERACEDCYKAEYLKEHIGEERNAIITGAAEFGVFAAMEDTCEGLISVRTLGEGEYSYDGMMTLRALGTGLSLRVGDKVRVKILNADVNSGKVDLELRGVLPDGAMRPPHRAERSELGNRAVKTYCGRKL